MAAEKTALEYLFEYKPPEESGDTDKADIGSAKATTEDKAPTTTSDRGRPLDWDGSSTPTTDNGSPAARAEVDEMQRAAPLLRLIQQDTGEDGHRSGDYVSFTHCPVCGHRDCFRFYPATNTWACFGASNATGYRGGGFIEYRKAAHRMSDVEAMTELRKATGHDYRDRAGKADRGSDRGRALDWDADSTSTDAGNAPTGTDKGKPKRPGLNIVSTDALTGDNVRKPPPDLVKGVMGEGDVMLIAAPSKTGKSWAALGLAWALCSGRPWMDAIPCRKSRVLYVNLELQQTWLSVRLDITKASGGYLGERFDTLTLRGDQFMAVSELRQALTEERKGMYDVVFIDPIYLFEEGPENDAETMIALMHEISRIATSLPCSVVFVHHFAKGNPSQKEPMDRPAGSGVLARFYDEAVILTPREPDTDSPEWREVCELYGPDARVFEFYTSSRNYGEDGLNSVIWAYPLFHADIAGTCDGFPIKGSDEAKRLKGNKTNSDKFARERAAKDSATAEAVERCKATGLPPTRKNVYDRFLERCCEHHGIAKPSESTFERDWTGTKGVTHFRTDPARGHELHPIDPEAVTPDNPKPFLATAEGDE